MNTQMLALWGSPGSGKTVTAVKLAHELAAHKKNVVILMCDSLTPAPQTLIPNTSTEGKSLGDLLTLPTISQEAILHRCIPFGKNPYISLLGYMRGDNAFTYAAYSKDRAVDLLTLIRHVADYVLIDVSSAFSSDVLSTVALENADAVLRLCTCDLKSMSYFSSNLPLLADGRFASAKHINVLSVVKPGQDSGEYSNTYGGAAYTLPYVPELEEQFYSATLSDELCTKAAKKYNQTIQKMVAVLLDEEAPSFAAHDKKQRPVKEPKEKKDSGFPALRKKEKPQANGGGIFEKLKKGDKS